MTIEGIWTGEVYGPFGWETRGVFVFENGRIVGGDNRQYSMGTYNLSGKTLKADLLIHYYGPPRTVFGEAREEFRIKIEGKLKGGVITGMVRRIEKPKYDIQIRLTKRMDIPVL